jgi:hypothetical protein
VSSLERAGWRLPPQRRNKDNLWPMLPYKTLSGQVKRYGTHDQDLMQDVAKFLEKAMYKHPTLVGMAVLYLINQGWKPGNMNPQPCCCLAEVTQEFQALNPKWLAPDHVRPPTQFLKLTECQIRAMGEANHKKGAK